jgi:chromosome segregation ATPase
MNERVEIEFTRELTDLQGRVARLEAERDAAHDERVKEVSMWKASGIGVIFALLLQALHWLWRHFKP